MVLHLAAITIARANPVTFSFTNSAAKQVQIAGDFNAWTKPYAMSQTGDRWTFQFDLPDDGRIEYKFVIDGNWILDPANPKRFSNGLGGENSVWEGPRYRPVVHDALPKSPFSRSELTVDGRRIVIYSPSNSVGAPIVVYGDGPTYESPGNVQNFAANLVDRGRIKPMVIVLVPPIDRMKEYGADWKPYGDFIFDRVVPAVRVATRASTRAEDLFMGGSSMGGLISLRLAEEFPEKLAGGIQCQSAAIQWKPLNINFDEVNAPAQLKKIAPTARIWLDWGEFEDGLTDANRKLVRTLRDIHRPFGMKTSPEGHTWTAWRNRMEAGLTYLFGVKGG